MVMESSECEKLKCCVGLAVIYAEILFILSFGGVNIIPEQTVWYSFFIPTTIPQMVGIPFYAVAFLVLFDYVQIGDHVKQDDVVRE